MTIRTLLHRGRYVLVAASLIAGLAACSAPSLSGGPSGSSASSAAAKAKVPASAADQRLKQDGYTPAHIPGFGKFDVGVNLTSEMRYEAVYTYAGHNAALVKQVVAKAQQKLTSDGVQRVSVNDDKNLIVIQAHHLKDLLTAGKAVLAAANL